MVSIRMIRKSDAEDFCNSFHYLKGLLRFDSKCLGLICGGVLAGIVVFSKSFEVVKDARVFELTRFCLAPGAPKNTASEFLSKCLKLIDKQCDVVITYADEEAGHFGVLYQACSAFYLGKVAEGISYKINGVIYSGRFIEKKIRAFIDRGEKIDLIKSEGKHKYVFVVAENKKKKTELRKNFTVLSKLYPKQKI